MLNMFNIEIFPQRLKQVKHDFQQNIFDFDKVGRRSSFDISGLSARYLFLFVWNAFCPKVWGQWEREFWPNKSFFKAFMQRVCKLSCEVCQGTLPEVTFVNILYNNICTKATPAIRALKFECWNLSRVC